MALDDFARAQDGDPDASSGGVKPDDEDLFNFPVIEMKSEVAKSAQVPASSAVLASPTAPLPAKKPAPSKPPSTLGIAVEHAAPPPKTEPEAKVESHTSVREIAHAPLLRVDASTEATEPFGDQGAPAPTTASDSRTRLARTPGLVWTAAIVLLLLNSAGFFLLWTSNRSFHSTVDGLRDDLAVAAHDMQTTNVRASVAPATVEVPPSPTVGDASRASPTRIASFEETAVDLARREIELGRYAAARMRLNRLLAIADRLDPASRADVEARASFLVGESYAVEIDRRLEVER